MAIEGGTQPGSFNLLNTPDGLYKALGQERFWEQVNKPWLDAAIRRGDDIALSTRPDPTVKGLLVRQDGTLTGFGREIDYLKSNGFTYDHATGRMTKK